jgi:hypothetical protein
MRDIYSFSVDVAVPPTKTSPNQRADIGGTATSTASDVSQTKSKSGSSAAAPGSTFREDIYLDGFVDGTDVSFVKSKSGSHISGP